jgi:hypothetical protein
MEKADPLFLLIGLPTIPIVLILGRMIRWEEAVLKFWRKHSSKLPLMNYLFPNGNFNKNKFFNKIKSFFLQIVHHIYLVYQLNVMEIQIPHH